MPFENIPYYEIENTYKRETKRGEDLVIEAIDIDEGKRITNDIILKTKSGKSVSFAGFLKDKVWKFQYDPAAPRVLKSRLAKFCCFPQHKLIFYSTLDQDGALLGLLHEIGHANLEKENKGSKYLEKQGFNPLYEYIQSPENQELTEDDIHGRGENPRDYIAAPYLMVVGGENLQFRHKMFIPKDLLIKYGKLHAENERKSWAFALNTLRKLKQKGIILEENLKDLKSLEKLIYGGLISYEKNYKDAYSPEMNYFTKGKKF